MGQHKIGLAALLTGLGALSIGSLFVLIPFSIGYFAHFDLTLMACFSLTDLYMFFSFPVLFVILISLGFVGIVGPIVSVRAKKTDAGQVSLRVFYPAALVCVASGLAVPVGIVLMGLLMLALLSTLIALWDDTEKRALSYVRVFFLAECVMVISGNVAAVGRDEYAPAISVQTARGREAGKAVFAGVNAVLLSVDDGSLNLVRTDNGTKIIYPKGERSEWLGCIDWTPVNFLRNSIGISCAWGHREMGTRNK